MAATNEALSMVEGAAFFLLCHDDCALDPDVVHNLVEESFRSNAGLVSPKFVNWDDPSVLLHVGMSCDKTGAVVDRIQDGEVDHGQHDAVRDVFVAPGGCILVRADLFRELGGFDAGIVAMGEDLDLSWRCQVAGSRVVVAPDARVRHREVVAGGIATAVGHRRGGAAPTGDDAGVATPPRAAGDVEVLRLVPPPARPAPGRPALLGRSGRRPLLARPPARAGRHGCLDLEPAPPFGRASPAAPTQGPPALPRLRGPPPAVAGECTVVALHVAPVAPGVGRGQRRGDGTPPARHPGARGARGAAAHGERRPCVQ